MRQALAGRPSTALAGTRSGNPTGREFTGSHARNGVERRAPISMLATISCPISMMNVSFEEKP